jgi:predicted dehydrogenase
MVSKSDYILVIGGGSIGERHMSNLLLAGYEHVVVLRKRNLPFRNQALAGLRIVTSEEDALDLKPKAAIICTPTSMHLQQTIWCLEHGMHVLVEKPLSHNLEQWENLTRAVNSSGKLLFVGYMMRYHPLVGKMQQIMAQGNLGRLLSFTSHWGEYLPNWHPWEDYRTSYAAKKELGGGASLTLSHDLDLVNHLVGKQITNYQFLQNHASGLEVTADAGADFLMAFEGGITGHVHLNYFEQPANRFLHLVFEKGRLEFYYFKNELHLLTPDDKQLITADDFDRNQLFTAELDDFFTLAGSLEQQEVSEKMLRESEIIIRMCNNEPIHS